MDEELTLHELRRLEAERKLRTIPAQVLETAWVRDAQVEAVIDAVLAVTYAGDAAAYAHARHVGEWCAQIALTLPFAPKPSLARRVGVLSDVDPASLEMIPELSHIASFVREYQCCAIQEKDITRTMAVIVAIADEFDARIGPDANGFAASPSSVLRTMIRNASEFNKPFVEALSNAVHFQRNICVA